MRLAFLLFALAYALLVSAPAFAAAPPMPSCTILGVPLCLPGYSVVKDSVNVTRGLTYPVGWPHTFNGVPLTAPMTTEEGQHVYYISEDGAGNRKWESQVCSFTANDCNLFALSGHNAKMVTTPAAEKRAVEQAAWNAFFTYTCDAETAKRTDWMGKVCVEHINTLVINQAAWLAKMPAQARWAVAYNSACSDANKLAGTCTRPVSVYNPVTKTRSVAKGETVAVGAPCYPAVVTHKDSTASSVIYMAIDPLRTDRVAVCSKAS